MLTHIVLFKLRDAAPKDIADTVDRLRALDGAVPSLRGLEVGVDVVNSPLSYDVGLIARFDDIAGLRAYQVHPAHLPVLAYIDDAMESRIAVDFVS